jgi:isopentenyldiphosphate isomerase
MEFLDIYTDKFKYIGTCEKKECHTKGYWHKVITVLVVNPKKRTVYFQRKWPADKVVTEDNALLDFTVGGHIQAGETQEQSVREIKEELLEDVSLAELVFLGIRQTAATVTPTYIANEFQYIYLYPTNKTLDNFNVNGDEIARLVEVNLDDALKLFFNETESINSKEKYLDENQKYIIKDRKVTKSNFMECYQIIDEFFKRMLIVAKRFCDGEDTKYLMW